MYIKRQYGFWMTFNWSKWPFILGSIYSLLICFLAYELNLSLNLPWQPLSIIGIAVAFYLGFKNNSSYDRTWEARKIWGSIVNSSRSFAAALFGFLNGDNEASLRQELIYRHVAWLQALRLQLRTPRSWEHPHPPGSLFAPDVTTNLKEQISAATQTYLPADELLELSKFTNPATQLLRRQSERLRELHTSNHFDTYKHAELQKFITQFYEDQGKSERIKNFPFPRQYASTALWLTIVFCLLVPFGLVDIFAELSAPLHWICPIISALIIWIFMLMEKIGDYSENPFEGTFNDVPISSIARSIEIDLREMINDSNVPGPLQDDRGFLM